VTALGAVTALGCRDRLGARRVSRPGQASAKDRGPQLAQDRFSRGAALVGIPHTAVNCGYDRPGEGLGLRATSRVEFTEMGDRLLNDFAADTDGAVELPVGVGLAIFRPCRVPDWRCRSGGAKCERRDRGAAPFRYRSAKKMLPGKLYEPEAVGTRRRAPSKLFMGAAP
jgi:hypothetical protein